MPRKRMSAPLETKALKHQKAIRMIPRVSSGFAPETQARGVDVLFGAQVPEREKLREVEKPGSVAGDIAAIFRENARLRRENGRLSIENEQLKRQTGGAK